MSDTLEIFGQEWTGVTGFKATDDNDTIKTFIRPQGTISISQSGDTDVTNYATANVPAGTLGYINVPLPQTNDFYIGIDSSTGVVTAEVDTIASATPVSQAGYLDTSASTQAFAYGTKSLQLTTQAAQTIHPSTSDQTIASGRYLTGTQTIKAVTTTNLTAENIKSGVVVQIGDSTDADCVKSITGTYEGGGGSSKNIQVNSGSASVRTNGYTSTGLSLTVAKTGTYKVSWTAWRSSSSGTMGTNLHRNNSSGTNQQTWTNTYGQHIVLNNQSYTAGDVLTLYATAGSNSRYCWVAGLTIEEQ